MRKLFENTKANVDTRLLKEANKRDIEDFEYKLTKDKDITRIK